MASVSKEVQYTKDGQRYWKISVSRGYGKSPYTTRYYWGKKANGDWVAKSTALNGLDRAVAEFEAKCKNGEVLSREEQRKKAEAEALEIAKIKTLRQYGEQVFMPNKVKVHKVAEKTRRYYQTVLDCHLYPAFGDMPLPEISVSMLRAFFLSDKITSLSHSTQNGIYVTANQLFEMAYREDIIPNNPIDKVDRPRESKEDKSSTPPRFTSEELKQIKDGMKNEPLKWQAFISVLMNTGMRRGEVCALTWDKIVFPTDESKGYIIVDGNLGYTPEAGIYRKTPKTKSGVRKVPMIKELADILTAYKAEQAESVKKRAKRLERENKVLSIGDLEEYKKKIEVPEYLFTIKGTSDPIFPDSVNRYFSRFSKEYGIKDFHPHKFRHTFVSVMLERGVPVIMVASIVGHEDASVTNRTYAHASPEGINNAMDEFESYMIKIA